MENQKINCKIKIFLKLFKIVFISILLLCSFYFYSASAKTTYFGVSENFEYYINDYGDNYKVVTLTKYIGNDINVFVPDEIDGYPITYTEQTFKNNTAVQQVEFSNGITAIGPETFYGCVNLKKVILPETLKTLNEFAFAYSGIETIDLPKETHYVGNGCFYGCKKLSFVRSYAEKIPFFNNSIILGDYAFFDTGFVAIQIPSQGFLEFHDNTFNGDYKVTTSGFLAFLYRHNLTRVLVEFLFGSSNFLIITCNILLFFLFIIFIIYLISSIVKLIKRIFGKDMFFRYKKHERDIISNLPNPAQNYITFRKVTCFSDIVINVLKISAFVALFIMWLTLFFVINSNIHFPWKYTTFYSTILETTIILTAYILLTVILLVVFFNVTNKIKKKNKNCSIHVKARKVRKYYYGK